MCGIFQILTVAVFLFALDVIGVVCSLPLATKFNAEVIGERISQDFQRLEESVANMKANADALNRDIATIHSNIVQEY
ncbi:hypothetical protein ACSLOD_28415, partial [Escherichia coli]